MKSEHNNRHTSFQRGRVAAGMTAAALSLVTVWHAPVWAQANNSPDNCGQRTFPQVSPEIARRAGMVARPGGLFEMNVDKLVTKAGNPVNLLRLSREQHQVNKHWLASMGRLVADPGTPLLPEVQALYQQGWETNLVEMSIIHAMECRLGLPLSDLESPKAPAVAIAERETRIAQARANEAAESQKLANRARMNNALTGLANVLNTVTGVLNSTSQSKSRGGDNDCPWDGHDYSCETAVGRGQ